MTDIPNLVSVTATRAQNGEVRFQISSLEAGAIVDVNMSTDMALMVCKTLMNTLAGFGEIPDDQRC